MNNKADHKEYVIIKKCPLCGGKWKFYNGLMGYESLQCEKCRFDIQDIKIVSEEQK